MDTFAIFVHILSVQILSDKLLNVQYPFYTLPLNYEVFRPKYFPPVYVGIATVVGFRAKINTQICLLLNNNIVEQQCCAHSALI